MHPLTWIRQFTAWIKFRNYARLEKIAVRLAVPAALAASLFIALLLTVPKPLPGAALGSPWVLRALWVLAIFYGFLLLFLPLIRSLRGQLPIELSLRGPRYEEAAATTADEDARSPWNFGGGPVMDLLMRA